MAPSDPSQPPEMHSPEESSGRSGSEDDAWGGPSGRAVAFDHNSGVESSGRGSGRGDSDGEPSGSSGQGMDGGSEDFDSSLDSVGLDGFPARFCTNCTAPAPDGAAECEVRTACMGGSTAWAWGPGSP
jgi:hypothetical protein